MARVLSEADIRAVLPIADLVGAIESALAAFSCGQVVQPVRAVVEMSDAAFFGAMPGFIPGDSQTPAVLGAKLVAVIAANRRLGLPTHRASILLLDPETGALAAVMDGRLITAMRTAAASAVSVRHMARADAAVLAILGSGVQARSHLAALPLVRAFQEVRAWSPTRAHLEMFAAEAPVPVVRCPTASEAVRDADVIVLATAATTPAIESGWVSGGAHVISIGACRPTHREMDTALVTRARLVVDSKAAAFAESGDIVLGIREGLFAADHVVAELGEIVAGRLPGRTSRHQVTLFKSLGLAVEDLASAHLAYERALTLGKGVAIDLGD
jgi:alanine dehydrogenase